MDFKDKMQALLDEHNIKPADLCKQTGIPSSLMSNYLKGIRSPGMDNSIKIANAFNVSLDELAGRKSAPEDSTRKAPTVEDTAEAIMTMLSAKLGRVPTPKEMQLLDSIVDGITQYLGGDGE